jgi:hypothetical protein
MSIVLPLYARCNSGVFNDNDLTVNVDIAMLRSAMLCDESL